MELRVAMSGRWPYAALNPDPGKQRGRGQDMACRFSVALSDHGDRADQIEARGARCFVVDPRKFRIIKDSWNKTDKQDARNLAKALWVHVVTGEFGIPTVYKPAVVVRELRKLFSQYCLLNRQIATHKNNAQAIFVENRVELKKEAKRRLFASEIGLEVLKDMNVSAASRVCL